MDKHNRSGLFSPTPTPKPAHQQKNPEKSKPTKKEKEQLRRNKQCKKLKGIIINILRDREKLDS
jgi:hypothetical protein